MNNVPKHVAIIMDGNGRWAQQRMLPRQVGHVKGAGNLREVIKASHARGIECLTVFAFSTENWRRPPAEVSFLFDLFRQYLNNELESLRQKQIQLRIIGDRSAFSPELQQQIQEVEAATVCKPKLQLTVALNYGGKWDVLQAVKSWQKANPERSVEQLDPEQIEPYLSTTGLPDPDLLIRTGGESRLSNFLIWQCAYTELYFSSEFWPDFNADSLDKALQSYGQRVRRFGKTDEQVASKSAL